MKKFYYSLFAAASMMLAVTSCSQEEDFVQSSSEMTTFSVQLDGATQSRTAGDGKTVDKLYYAVYSESTGEVVYPAGAQYGTANKEDGGWKLDLPLMKSETYDILFWAQKDGSGAYEFTNLKEITVKYDGVLSNKEDRDAFFNALDDFKASGSEHTIVLRRPFAQLNVATTIDDWNKAKTIYNSTNNTTGVNPVSKSAVTVSALATKFNVLTGEASVPTTGRVTFGANTLIDESIKIKRMVEGVEKDVEYKLLAMNYLLPEGTKEPNGLEQYNPEEGKENTEVEFTLYKGTDEQIVNVKVPATPIQRNWRTNIIGDLLTGEGFDVVIEKGFDNEENQEIEISADGIVKDADGIYHITTTEGLWNLARLVNNGSQSASTGGRAATVGYTFEGETFVLDCDVDLQGEEWTPMDNFAGTFDGKGKTITNFNVNKAKSAGLFGTLGTSAVIKNLTVTEAAIVGHHYAGVIAGYGYATIDNCHVKNSTVTLTTELINGAHDNGDKAGAIIGYLCEEVAQNAQTGIDYVKNCSAENVTIRGYRDIGGLVGIANGTATVSNNTISNSIIVIDKTNNYENYTTDEEFNGGEYVGRIAEKATVENNIATEVEITYIGGDDYEGYYVDAEGNYIATASEGIKNIIAEGQQNINLSAGSFDMPTDGLAGKTLSFAGSRNAVLDLTPVAGDYQHVSGATLTFDGITLNYGTANYKGLQHAQEVTYNDCAINGLQFLYAPTTFTNCELNSNGAEHSVWTYGADEVEFNNCTFTYGDRAVNCYSDQSGQATVANFTNCTFNKVSNRAADVTGAIETNSSIMTSLELNITNCTVNEGELWWISKWDEKKGANTVVTIDGKTIYGYDNDGNRLIYVSNDKELNAAITNALTVGKTIITLASGIYSEDINLTVAALGSSKGENLVFKAAEGAEAVIAGNVTLGYRNQGVGATMFDTNVTFEGITFDHAEAAKHSITVMDVKSLTLKNCNIIGDGEYGLDCARGNGTGTSKIEGCTFENAGMQLLGNFATGLVIDYCTFNESRINVQAGNGVTVQNCTFKNTLTSANEGDSFYLVRSNSTPITVKDCTINIDSELTEEATSQAKWGILWNRGTTNWTVENVDITLTDAALVQTDLEVTKTTSTGVINTTNLTVNGKVYASTLDQLNAAINAGATEIALANGKTLEGVITINKSVTISSLNVNKKSTIKGRVDISADASFNNIKFEINEDSKTKNVFTGANYKYPSTANIYAAAASFEGCEFVTSIAAGVCGINYGSHTAGKMLTVNNCTFTGDFYAIRSRTLFSITNSNFNIYTDQGTLAAVFTWGNGEQGTEVDNGANSVTFTGNTNANEKQIYGAQLTSTTFNYCKININVQNNTNFIPLKEGVDSKLNFTGCTFTEGSETF